MLGIKLVICMAICLICTYMGMEMAHKLKSREMILTECVTFLKMVENEMVYMLNNLPLSYEMARQKLNTKLKDVIGSIVVDINKYGIEKSNISSVENVNKLDELTLTDKEIIITLLNSLGRGDLDSQCNIIENGIEVLKNQIKEARESKIKNSKVYRMVGAISGLMIVIIFI